MSIFVMVTFVLVWGLLHSVLASMQVKAVFQKWFGLRFMRYYRFGYNLISALSILPLLILLPGLPDRELYSIPMPWLVLTGLGQLASLAILTAGMLQTDALDFIGVRALWDPSPRPARLVTDGIYRHLRHPLYTGGLLFIWLSPVMTVNLLTLYIAFTIYVIIGALFEERKLLREFGSSYAGYRARTPMLIPRPGRNKTIPPASYH